MASYHFCIHSPVSRGKGKSIVATAAYNGRCRLVDERTGEVWDYRHLGATLFSGIYAPKDAPDWARDLQQLVNEIERVEKRSDAQLAFNIDIALPHELGLEQNRRLAQDFVREEWQRKGYAVITDIHAPDPEGDSRNIHLHVWGTLRKIDADGFARTKTEQQENYRNRSEYTEYLREKWEHLANRHLERAGLDARIDRRSLEDQGIEREPQQHRGPAVTAMERDGNVTRIGDEIRRRQGHYADLKALGAEEKQIDAQIIDLQAARAEREARAAARGRTDEIRPDRSAETDRQAEQAMQAAREAAKGRTDDIRPEPTVQPDYAAAKGWVDDIRPDPASRDFSRAAETAREAVQAHEAPAAPSVPEPAQTPSQAAARAGPPMPEPDHELRSPESIFAKFFGGIGKALASFIEQLADSLAPPPPPTKDQAERMVRAAEENQQERAEQAAQTERAEAQHWLVEEARRRAAEREAGLSPESQRDDGLDRHRSGRSRDEDDYDRGRERGYER